METPRYYWSSEFIKSTLGRLHHGGVSYKCKFDSLTDMMDYFNLLSVPVTYERILPKVKERLEQSKEKLKLKKYEFKRKDGVNQMTLVIEDDFTLWSSEKQSVYLQEFFKTLGVPPEVSSKEVTVTSVEKGSVVLVCVLSGVAILAIGIGVGAYLIINDAHWNDRQYQTLFVTATTLIGAGSGALVGTFFGPGIGTVIGGGIGAVTGLIGGAFASSIIVRGIHQVRVNNNFEVEVNFQ